MNIAEGSRRMRQGGQWSILIGLSAFVLLWGFAMAARIPIPEVADVFRLVLLGVALWLAGWIVESFAKDGH